MSWRERFPEEVTCVRCLEVREVAELDRLLWCDECKARARRRAGKIGWLVGVLAGAVLALWIWLWVQPSDLILGGWIGVVVAALYLSARAGREIAYGVMRFRNRKAIDATPPELGRGSSPGS